VPIRIRSWIFAATALVGVFAAGPALAQPWGVGASYGLVEDVSHSFSLDQFHSHDASGWIEYEVEPAVQLRGTFGSLRTTGNNSERTVTNSSGESVVAPRLTSRIDYATIGVSYEFLEGDTRSGVFAGIGGYKIRPDAAPPGFEEFRDPSTTTLGWHAGVDGSIRLVSALSAVGRLSVHGFDSGGWRAILTADAGLAFRF
jgi:hypothetical protein